MNPDPWDFDAPQAPPQGAAQSPTGPRVIQLGSPHPVSAVQPQQLQQAIPLGSQPMLQQPAGGSSAPSLVAQSLTNTPRPAPGFASAWPGAPRAPVPTQQRTPPLPMDSATALQAARPLPAQPLAPGGAAPLRQQHAAVQQQQRPAPHATQPVVRPQATPTLPNMRPPAGAPVTAAQPVTAAAAAAAAAAPRPISTAERQAIAQQQHLALLKIVFGRLCNENAEVKELWYKHGKLIRDKYPQMTDRDELQKVTCAGLHDLITRDDKYAALRVTYNHTLDAIKRAQAARRAQQAPQRVLTPAERERANAERTAAARREEERRERERQLAEERTAERRRQAEEIKNAKRLQREAEERRKAEDRARKVAAREAREAEKVAARERKAEERAAAKAARERDKAQKQAERRAAGIKPKPSGGRKKKDDFEMFRILDDDAALSLPRSGPVPAAVALARPSGGKKRPAKPVIGGPAKRAKSDQPVGITFDMDTEEAALTAAALKLSERHSHKPVLLEDALLNDAPLRARLVHVAAQHGVRLVHPGVVKVLNLAAEALLTRLVKDMMHAAALRSKQAKDVPGMAKDVDRNWAREVAIIATDERETAARARIEQQQQQDQQTLAQHQNRRRGADETERQRRKESVDAAKSRLTTAEEKSKVNEGLKRILPVRRFGAGKRSMFRQRPKQQLNAHLLPAGPAAGASASGEEPAASGAAVPTAAPALPVPGLTKEEPKKVLGVEELLFVLKRDPVYARSAAHYRMRCEHTLAQAMAPAQ